MRRIVLQLRIYKCVLNVLHDLHAAHLHQKVSRPCAAAAACVCLLIPALLIPALLIPAFANVPRAHERPISLAAVGHLASLCSVVRPHLGGPLATTVARRSGRRCSQQEQCLNIGIQVRVHSGLSGLRGFSRIAQSSCRGTGKSTP